MKIDKLDLQIIKKIALKFNIELFAYGSRVNGDNKKFSDLDLCIIEDISDEKLLLLKETFIDSNISIKIDLCRISDFSDKFFDSIKNSLMKI